MKVRVDKQRAEIELRQVGQRAALLLGLRRALRNLRVRSQDQKYRKLTDARGYDAEGSWSPDGKLIAFSSNRRAYEGELTADGEETIRARSGES